MADSIGAAICILHVDDDPSFLRISKLMLKTLEKDFIVDTITGVDEAVQKLTISNHYDIIISDYDMPIKNGLDFLKELKERKIETPFILFTGKGREEIAIQALNLGADGYINKQGAPETVYGELTHIIKNAYKLKKIKTKLQLSEEKYSALYKNSPDAITITTLKNGKLIEVNESALQFFGFSQSEIIGKTSIELDTWESAAERDRFVNLLKQNGKIKNIEFKLKKKDKTIVIASMSASIININNETCMHTTFRDVTEQYQDKAKIQESEKRYRTLIETATEAIFVHDFEGKIIDANMQACKNTGYTKDELLSMYASQMDVNASKDKAGGSYWESALKGEIITFESNQQRKDKTTFPVEISLRKITLGGKDCILASTRDITERKKVEKALIQAKLDWERTFNSIPDYVAILDNEYNIVRVNASMAKQLGVTPEDAVGLKCYECIHGLDSPPDFCPHSKTMLDGKQHTAEVYEPRLNGEFSISTSPLRDENGVIIGSVHVSRNMTEYKKAEDALRLSEEKFRKTFETSPDAIYLNKQNDSTILEVNERLTALFGYSREQLIGKKTSELNIWANLHDKNEIMKDLRLNGVVHDKEVVWRKKNGELFPGLLSVSIVQFGNEEFTVGIVKDITEIKKTEEDLKKKQTALDALLSSANSPMFMVDTQYSYLAFNSAHAATMKALYGVDIKIGESLLDYMTNPTDREIAKGNIDKALSGEYLEDGRETGDPNLQRSYFTVRHYPVKKDNQVVAVSITALPTTMQGTAGQKGHAITAINPEQEFTKLLSTMKEGVCIHQVIYDEKGKAINYRILSANSAFEKMTGIKEENAKGKLATELYGTPEPPYLEVYSKVAETGITTSFETFFPPMNMYVQISVFSPRKSQFGTIFQDITEQKQTQDALKKSEAQYRLLAEKTTDVIWTMNVEGKFTYVSPSVEKLRGYTPQEVMNQKITEALTPKSAQTAIESLQQFSQKNMGSSGFFELEQPCKDGSTVWTEVNISTIPSKDGEPPAILGVSRNISERKKSEEKLHRSELILENSSDSIITTDLTGNITSWNKGAEAIFGYTSEEMIGQHITRVVKAEEKEQVAPKQLDEVRKGKDFAKRWEGVRKDGSTVWLLLTTKIIKNSKDEPIGMAGFGKDITEYKKVEDELELSSSVINLVSDSIHVIDMKGNLIYFNEATYKNRGYSLEEMSAMNIYNLDAPESAALIESRMKQLAKKGYAMFESVQLCKDGTRVPVEIFARVIGEGDNKLFLSIARDISERKTAEVELRKSKEQTELVKEKLRVLGSLTRHDVGNKLMAVKSSLLILKQTLKDNPEMLDCIKIADQAVDESDKIFKFSKFYEKIGAEQPTIVDVAEQFNEATRLRPHTNLEVTNQVKVVSVLADSMLQQLFYNLIDNSIKHGKTVSKIKLSAKQVNGQIKLIYEDNGVGIPKENKDKIFAEGFTTGGTGLGLKLVKRMIEVYGWAITEEGEAGKGAKFVITIPTPITQVVSE